MDLRTLLQLAMQRGASDLHLKVGTVPVLRLHGALTPLPEFGRLTPEQGAQWLQQILGEAHKRQFQTRRQVDLSYGIPGLGRFRVNCFQQRGSLAMVFRVIPTTIPTIQELRLPPVVERLALEPRGLILVTGTTGSGKSTTLAAMIEHINQRRAYHIITIEDPVEFLHRDKRSLINQREVGTDTPSFAEALRSALRQDPDVILVGEMRDFDTVATVLQAAETGHLVLSTLHTIDAAETIHRIISVFPPYQHQQVRYQLASVIRGIICLRLIPRADGQGRVPAVEVLVATPSIRKAIEDPEKTGRIRELIAAGASQYGMQTFDQSLLQLYQQGLITYEEALRRATNPDDFALRVQGIENTSDTYWSSQEEAPEASPPESSGPSKKFPIEHFST